MDGIKRVRAADCIRHSNWWNLLLLALLLAACTPAALREPAVPKGEKENVTLSADPTASATAAATQTVPVEGSVETLRPSPTSTATHAATTAPAGTAAAGRLPAVQVWPGEVALPEGPPPECSRDEIAWFDFSTGDEDIDGVWLRFVVTRLDSCQPKPQPARFWLAYALESGEISRLEPWMQYDESIWAQLDLEPPSPQPQLDGYVSHSGRYALAAKNYGEAFNDPQARSELWLVDVAQGEHSLLMSLPDHAYVSPPAWLPDEAQVVAGYGFQSPQLYVIDVDAAEIEALSERVEYPPPADHWALAAESELLALPSDLGLWIIDLAAAEAGPLPAAASGAAQFGFEPVWSPDGGTLYFWEGSRYAEPYIWRDLQAFDLASGERRTLIESGQMIQTLGEGVSVPFRVEPQEGWVALASGGELWMVEAR